MQATVLSPGPTRCWPLRLLLTPVSQRPAQSWHVVGARRVRVAPLLSPQTPGVRDESHFSSFPFPFFLSTSSTMTRALHLLASPVLDRVLILWCRLPVRSKGRASGLWVTPGTQMARQEEVLQCLGHSSPRTPPFSGPRSESK